MLVTFYTLGLRVDLRSGMDILRGWIDCAAAIDGTLTFGNRSQLNYTPHFRCRHAAK